MQINYDHMRTSMHISTASTFQVLKVFLPIGLINIQRTAVALFACVFATVHFLVQLTILLDAVWALTYKTYSTAQY